MKVLVLFSLFISVNLFAQEKSSSEPIAKITFLRGAATVNGEPARFPNALYVGDKIVAFPKTKPKKTGSFVRITFNNGDKIGLSNGSMVIEKLDKMQSVFGLIKGRLFNYAKPGQERKVTIKSRNVSLAVRGTKYMIEEKEDESYICVCEGEVVATKGGRESSVKAGFDLHVKPGKPINQSVEATEVMLKMVADNFKLMGEPVTLPTREKKDKKPL